MKAKLIEWMDINLSTQSKLGASDEAIRQLLSVRSFIENYPDDEADLLHMGMVKQRQAYLLEIKQLKEDSEKDLISFGSYLLSEEREKRIMKKENLRLVGDWDIQNWKHLKDNIKNQ